MWPRAHAAPDGVREIDSSHTYKHCGPDGAGKIATCVNGEGNERLQLHFQLGRAMERG